MIASAHLPQLEFLEINGDPSMEFLEKMFEGTWPALKSLNGVGTGSFVLPLTASKSWLTNLERLVIGQNYEVTADQLNELLKALQRSMIKELVLFQVHVAILLDGFRGIKLDHLKCLSVQYSWYDSEDDADVSNYINVLFDSCSFPKLEKLEFGEFNHAHGEDTVSKWIRPPSTSVEQLIYPLINMEEITFFSLYISQDVADYLGSFRRKTACDIEMVGEEYLGCLVAERVLSPHRQQILDKLDVDLGKWKEFCVRIPHGIYLYEEFRFWNILSDLRFKRVAFGAALMASSDCDKLEKFIKLCEGEEEGSVFKPNALEEVKRFLEKMREIQNDLALLNSN